MRPKIKFGKQESCGMPTSPTECLLSAKQVQAYNEGDNADSWLAPSKNER